MVNLINGIKKFEEKITEALFDPYGEVSVEKAERIIQPSIATFLTLGFAIAAVSSVFMKDFKVSRIMLNVSTLGLVTINVIASRKFAAQGDALQKDNLKINYPYNDRLTAGGRFLSPMGHPEGQLRKDFYFSLFQGVILGAGTFYLAASFHQGLSGRILVQQAVSCATLSLMFSGAMISSRFLGRSYMRAKLKPQGCPIV